MEDLKKAYAKVAKVLRDEVEPFESVRLVEEYRRYFKPKRVRIVLLAESHVYTSNEDRKIKVPAIDGLPGLPDRYARFVYCPAYGERNLTDDERHPRLDGTPPFWKLLSSCVNPVKGPESFRQYQAVTSFETRLRNKVELLRKLKENEIWLVDASIVALYRNGKKPSRMNEAIRESWEAYTRQVVVSAKPEHVIVVGKSIGDILGDELKRLFPGRHTVIFQPTARLTAAEHLANFRRCHSICKVR